MGEGDWHVGVAGVGEQLGEHHRTGQREHQLDQLPQTLGGRDRDLSLLITVDDANYDLPGGGTRYYHKCNWLAHERRSESEGTPAC